MVEEQRYLPSVQVWSPSIPDILRASDECCADINLSRNRARIRQGPHPPAHLITTTVALEARVEEEAASCRTCSATSSLARPRITRPRTNMARAAAQTTTPGVPGPRIDPRRRAHPALLSLLRRRAKIVTTTYPEDGAIRWTDRVCVWWSAGGYLVLC